MILDQQNISFNLCYWFHRVDALSLDMLTCEERGRRTETLMVGLKRIVAYMIFKDFELIKLENLHDY